MTAITVHTQAELDAALTNPDHAFYTHEIIIDSPAGVTLVVDDGRGHRVSAFDSSTVAARDSSAVRAYDSSAVTAFGSSAVHAYGSSAVTSYDSSAVTAYDSSTVHAYGSSAVTARGSVAIHEHGPHTTIAGGVILDHTTTDATTPTEWAAKNGAPVKDGMVTLYKALPADLTSGRPFGHAVVWPTTGEVSCDDWRDDDERGGGLHLSPTPGQAWPYLCYETSPRFLECTAPLDSIVPIPGEAAKCKVERCTVVREVDVMGRPVTSEGAAS